MTAELLLKRRRPRDEAESQPVIDHGKAAGAETETLPECAIDPFASDNRPAW